MGRPSSPENEPYEGAGQAVREFILKDGHGRVDYLLFVDQTPVGTIEAKPDGTTLIEVELQSMLYTTGLPRISRAPSSAFLSLSSRRAPRLGSLMNLTRSHAPAGVFSFPRPETLKGWVVLADDDEPPTTLWRLQQMPAMITDNLWSN